MFNIHQELLTRPTYVEVDLSAIKHNVAEMRKHLGDTKILCILKGNAYGHGSVRVAQLLEELEVDYLGVAIPEEGVELRRAGITTPILVLSAIVDKQIPVCLQYDLSITAPSNEKLGKINEVAKTFGKRAIVHLKVDTGMNRIGVNHKRVQKFFPYMSLEHIHFEGIYSHFACANSDHLHNKEQIQRFKDAIKTFKEAGFSFEIEHMANSGASLFYLKSRFSMVRLGIVLYGLFQGRPIPPEIHLKPAMTWKTEVVYFKYIEEGSGVSYERDYVANRDTRIVTLPVGYADGYKRGMEKQGRVIIRDTMYPIAGRVCMDQLMIDIGIEGTAYKGDAVILAGSSPSHTISFLDIAKWSGTSVHDLLSQISYRVPRIYINSEADDTMKSCNHS